MKKLLLLFAVLLTTVGAWAQTVELKTSSSEVTPEYLYYLSNLNGKFMYANSSPTETSEDAGQFAFYEGDTTGDYYIYSFTLKKWISYDQAASYSNGTGKAVLKDSKAEANPWKIEFATSKEIKCYQIRPYKSDGTIASIYMNWYLGMGENNPYRGEVTVGLYGTSASNDQGSAWLLYSCDKYMPVVVKSRNNSDRAIGSISFKVSSNPELASNQIAVKHHENGFNYIDLTSVAKLSAGVGDEIVPQIKLNSGHWIHGYVFVDKDSDGFSDDDLASYNYLGGKNSKGENVNNNPGRDMTLPSFVAPSTPGIYRVRFKTDWDYANPTSFSNDDVWGTIVDVLLEVKYSLGSYADNPNTVFKLKNKASGLYMSIESENADAGIKIMAGVDEDKQKFFIIPAGIEDRYWIQCANHGNFIKKTGAWDAQTNAQPYAFIIEEVQIGEYKLYGASNQPGYLGPNANANAAGSPLYSNHNRTDDNLIWELEVSSTAEDKIAVAQDARTNVKPVYTQYSQNQTFRLKNNNGRYMTIENSEEIKGVKTNEKSDEEVQKFFMVQDGNSTKSFLVATNGEAIRALDGWETSGTKTLCTVFDVESPEEGVYRFKSELGYLGTNLTDENVLYSDKGKDETSQWTLELVEPTEENLTTVNTFRSIRDWRKETLSTLGYIGAYPKTFEDEIEAVAYSEEAKTTFIEDHQNDIVQMTPGYYRIQNLFRPQIGIKNMIGVVNGARKGAAGNMSAVDFIWEFEASNDGYKVKNLNRGLYMNTVGDQSLVEDANAGVYGLVDLGAAQWKLTCGGENLVMFYDNGALGHWGSVNQNSDGAWYIIPATELDITVSEAGWATTCLPFDVVLPEELTAYALTDVSGVNGEETGSVSLISKAGIKANQGALLNGASGTYTLSIEETASNWEANMLSGTTVAKDMSTLTGDVYLLTAGGENSAKLSKLVLADDATEAKKTLAANKAYLNIATSSARFLVFNFDEDNETAIESIGSEDGNMKEEIYDLVGRRVQNAQKGLYIVNGKKVIK